MTQHWSDACTTNCLWLFQTKQVVILNRGDLEYLDRRELFSLCREYTESLRELVDYIKDYESEGRFPECLIHYEKDCWDTHKVFLLREEARNYGQSRPYAWGEEQKDWRIYGGPRSGEILSILADSGVNQEFIDSKLKNQTKV